MQHNAESGDNDKDVPAKQALAAVLLASGASIVSTAQQIGVNRNTVSLWTRDPAFAKRVEVETNEFLRDTRASIRLLRDKALSTLGAILDGDNDAARARVSLAVLQTLGAVREPEPVLSTSTDKVFQVRFTVPQIGKSNGGDS